MNIFFRGNDVVLEDKDMVFFLNKTNILNRFYSGRVDNIEGNLIGKKLCKRKNNKTQE